ncbi:hypothetical protein DSM03_1293, partial [Leeuwenhoekiella aestuarii]
MANPCEIIEGGITYPLGSMQGKKMIYDFHKMLVYLNAKGKLLSGPHFKIYESDHPLLFKLCNYIIADKTNFEAMHLDPKKGLILSGPVGCGKTSLMKLLRHLVPHLRPYEVIP